MWHLKGKKALVTGGTKGIGCAVVEELLALEAFVLFVARNKNAVTALEKKWQKKGKTIYGIAADVSSTKDRERILQFVSSHFKTLDILVNNAGINIRKKALEYTEDEYQKIIAVNLLAPFELSRMFYPLLKKAQAASIINIASSAGIQDVRSGAPYAMAKAGILQQTRSLATEWASDGIRVNAVSPWYTQTPLTQPVFEQKERLDYIIKRTPMQRVAQPEEIAAVVAFLSMDKASYITGQNLIADGGMSISAL
ncbi:SDR family oxidoreductase [Ascidiimonas aurantiaca]|uniref:SDR family oxidoreductase n=1 Tax=Ascidiimonas aurantiaca TaxID=1685432 RepID=UPI0030EB9E0C